MWLKNFFISVIKTSVRFVTTRPKPVENGYVLSMAVGAIGEWLKLVPVCVRGRTVDCEGGGGGRVF